MAQQHQRDRDVVEEVHQSLKKLEQRVQFLEFCVRHRRRGASSCFFENGSEEEELIDSIVPWCLEKEETAPSPPPPPQDVKRVQEYALRELRLKVALTVQVPEHYYETPLSTRREFVQAPSEDHLCKTILLENTKCTRNDCSDPKNSRWYAVIIQYTTKLNSQKVFRLVRTLTPSLSRNQVHFRLAEEEDSKRLTGFGHNAIAPLGMLTPIPIILSDRIVTLLQPKVMYVGAGHVDWKLLLSVEEFVKKTNCFVADIVYDEGDAETPPTEARSL